MNELAYSGFWEPMPWRTATPISGVLRMPPADVSQLPLPCGRRHGNATVRITGTQLPRQDRTAGSGCVTMVIA